MEMVVKDMAQAKYFSLFHSLMEELYCSSEMGCGRGGVIKSLSEEKKYEKQGFSLGFSHSSVTLT